MEDQAQQLYKEGSDFFKKGHFSEALSSCNKALAIRPDYAEAWNGRGVALAELRQPAEALASYDKALAIRPDYANAWNNRGWALVELERHEEAVDSYDKALAINPDDASA
jgi:superkiller protein 3